MSDEFRQNIACVMILMFNNGSSEQRNDSMDVMMNLAERWKKYISKSRKKINASTFNLGCVICSNLLIFTREYTRIF